MSDVFSAGEQAAGYIFQVRYALLLALRDVEARSILVEGLDDVDFSGQDGTPSELLQFKHQVRRRANLTDRSPDLWKSIRVWATRIANGQIDPTAVSLRLMTTGVAPAGSVAASLKADYDRQAVLEILSDIARVGGSQENQAGYDAFLQLSPENRLALVQAISVVDSIPNVIAIEREIELELRWVVSPEQRAPLREQLEGWWYSVVVRMFCDSQFGPLLHAAFEQKITDLRNQYRPTALPDIFGEGLPSFDYGPHDSNRLFIRQLGLIGVSPETKSLAIQDYYMARKQRSWWLRHNLTGLTEIPGYDQRLTREWFRKWHQMLEDLSDTLPDLPPSGWEAAKRRHGKDLYRSLQDDLPDHLRIRSEWTAPYLHRGTYHILADRPLIGWHPDYAAELGHAEKEASADDEPTTA